MIITINLMTIYCFSFAGHSRRSLEGAGQVLKTLPFGGYDLGVEDDSHTPSYLTFSIVSQWQRSLPSV